jgi:peptide/nickel transport system substrate-binding protein
MFWLRWIFFSSPLWLGFGGAWLFRTVSDFQLTRESDAFVHAINAPIGYLGPLAPADGIEGEIAGLLFEPLLRRDEQLNLRPNLLERWTSRSVVTIRCESEEAAGEAEARILAGEAPRRGPRPIALERTGAILNAAFEGMEKDFAAPLLEALPEELLADEVLVRVTADHSVEKLVNVWLEGSIEKGRVRMLEFNGDRETSLFVRGETDRVLEDLRLYLDSNPATHPVLEEVGKRCHTIAGEILLDLRPGVTWHDGTPFTAADVVFSHRTLTAPDSPLPLADAFRFVESLEAVSPLRLRLRCREVPGAMLESWERLPLLPAHLLADATGPDAAAAYQTYLEQPVGLGPYRLERRRNDGGVELVAHTGYHLGVPQEPRLRYRRFHSLESILLALRSGTLDAIEPDERFTDWSERNPGTVETIRDVARFQHLVMWNLERAPFDRPEVRAALARAANPRELLRDHPTGFETPVTSLFFPGSPHVAEPLLLPLHDPRGAGKLLGEAGYTTDAESDLRKDAAGKPLAFTLAVNAANPGHLRLASGLAEQWAAVGVEARIEALPWSELISNRLPRREFDAVLLSWELPPGRDRRELWHSSEAGPGGGNLSGLRNAEVDAILDRLHEESDPVKITENTAALHQAIARLQPALFLCDSGRIVTWKKGALAMRPPGSAAAIPITIGKGGLRDSRPWWVKTAEAAP